MIPYIVASLLIHLIMALIAVSIACWYIRRIPEGVKI